MDILKKVYNNIESCTVDKYNVKIDDKLFPSSMIIEFPSSKYPLGAVVFFLKNSSLPMGQYVALCQKYGIQQIRYMDQGPIKEHISNYTISDIGGFFMKPVYTRNIEYSIPEIDATYYLIVLSDFISPFNIDNACEMLSEGFGVVLNTGRTGSNKISIEMGKINDSKINSKNNDRKINDSKINDKNIYSITAQSDNNIINFKLLDDVSQFKKKDWSKVKGVFINSKNAYEKKEMIFELSKTAAIFSINCREINATKLEIRDDKIVNIKEVWMNIKKYIE